MRLRTLVISLSAHTHPPPKHTRTQSKGGKRHYWLVLVGMMSEAAGRTARGTLIARLHALGALDVVANCLSDPELSGGDAAEVVYFATLLARYDVRARALFAAVPAVTDNLVKVWDGRECHCAELSFLVCHK